MYWVLQKKFRRDFDNREVGSLCHALDRFGIGYSFCEVVPFSDGEFIKEPEIPEDAGPIFTYGSYTLSKCAKKMGWTPGAFLSPHLNQDWLLNRLGDSMLNSDMQFSTLRDANPKGEFFMRPMEDTKSFIAKVRTEQEFNEWRESIANLEGEFSTVNLDTQVMWCTPKPIEQEIRFFVVNRKVVTCSVYKTGEDVYYKELVDEYIKYYAQGIVTGFSGELTCGGHNPKLDPDRAYVMDVAISNGKPYVLECNSINSSGLYAIDRQKFVMAIEDLGMLIKGEKK